MGILFGNRLRFERSKRGMSQAELARDYCSASYISLLEAGLREPTTDVILELARRLGVTPGDLNPTDPAPTGAAESVLAGLNAREAWDVRDYRSAAAHAASAAGLALADGRYGDWWSMSHMLAESLFKLGIHSEGLSILGQLLEHPIVSSSPALASRTHSLFAFACHHLGQADTAIIHARTALSLSADLPQPAVNRMEALRALIEPLADTGRLDEAWAHCLTLAALLDEETTEHLAGQIEWVIGKVAFMRGDLEQGVRHHGLAASLLSPVEDLDLWAQFTKASASARLAAGVVDEGTLSAIHKAEVSLEILGGNARERTEVALLRTRWLLQNAEPRAAAERLREISREASGLDDVTAGEVALLHGRVLSALGQSQQALELIDTARARFVQAEAWHRVSQCIDASLQTRITAQKTEVA